ncbi:type II secretion system F family protein [Romboutsia weinsteinii]|uniref:Type II secretion system F family protein n=1 Tax=Romboutsia weinsteinii TaxID=2020949 RepID=A0A371J1R1_9FIRM|nr:type II secretion system F family protein [Romboutsia weinsteinii]RDY26607.1 type II secretion system F family protein [Romboutsia weinsteinii]
MSTYRCVVYDEDRNRKVIKLDLESKNEVDNYAIKNKLKLVRVKKYNSYIKNKRVKDKDTHIICKQIAILLESGCEVTKLLSILEKQSSSKISKILLKISNHIQKGNSITDSFKNTKLFSNFFISMVRAGEVSGSLDKVMNNLSDYYNKEYKLKNKILGIMTYPIILMASSFVVMLFMLIKVIPNFAESFLGNGIEPPIMTKLLINVSLFVRENLIYITSISIVLLLSIVFYIITSVKARYFINKIKFKIPIVRDINQLVIVSRFSRSLLILLSSGVQIMDAIDISSKVIDNDFAYEQILLSSESLRRGNSISSSLELSNIFPNLFISMVSIGEESGKLDNTLQAITEFYDNELDTTIEQIIRLLEPAIIAIIGIIVGGGILIMLTPMFDLINTI